MPPRFARPTSPCNKRHGMGGHVGADLGHHALLRGRNQSLARMRASDAHHSKAIPGLRLLDPRTPPGQGRQQEELFVDQSLPGFPGHIVRGSGYRARRCRGNESAPLPQTGSQELRHANGAIVQHSSGSAGAGPLIKPAGIAPGVFSSPRQHSARPASRMGPSWAPGAFRTPGLHLQPALIQAHPAVQNNTSPGPAFPAGRAD